MPSPYIGCSKQRSLGGVDLISHCCLHEPPASERDLHRPIASTNGLDDILCWREQRSVSRQLVVNYSHESSALDFFADISRSADVNSIIRLYHLHPADARPRLLLSLLPSTSGR